MSINISWFIEPHIIDFDNTLNAALDDYKAANREIIRLLDHNPSPAVHVVMNTGNLAFTHLNLFQQFPGALSFLKHPKMGIVVGYGNEDPTLNMMIGSMARAANVRYGLKRTKDEAIQFLFVYSPLLFQAAGR